MATNKLYGLSEDYTELNTVFNKSEQTTEEKRHGDDDPVYVNRTLPKANGLSPSDAEEDYAALQDVHDLETVDQSKNIDVPKTESNQKEERWIYFVYASFVLVIALFVVVIGIVITLAITISGTKESKEMLQSLLRSGMWSDWESWSQCSVSCGLGSTYRNRTCSDNDGTYCSGNSTEYNICHITPCPVIDGGWSDWSSWEHCSVTCGTGIQSRLRTCSNPRPYNGGELCFGVSSEYRLCNNGICAVNITWNEWGSWSTCSASCDFGVHHRVRTCTEEDENLGATYCERNETEYRHCHEAPCAGTDGEWSSWSSWTICSSSTCTKIRNRTCDNPEPSVNGHMCEGNSMDVGNCDLTNCLGVVALKIRLANGTSRSGRLEVSVDGVNWGTVCDDGFDSNDARVACRMLGYFGSGVISNIYTIDGTGPIFLDDLACLGNETSLLYCNHGGWASHNCGHSEDVGVSC